MRKTGLVVGTVRNEFAAPEADEEFLVLPFRPRPRPLPAAAVRKFVDGLSDLGVGPVEPRHESQHRLVRRRDKQPAQ